MDALAPLQRLSPLLELAKQILLENRKALHVNDIAALAVQSNRNMQLPAEELASKLSSALAANVKTQSPIFAKPKNKNGSAKKGVYRLRNTALPPPPKTPEPPTISTNFIGKAGEHAAMSELLFWGYNASLMSVDEGIDIVASKHGHYFHIQVKSSAETQSGKFQFKVRAAAFNKHNTINTFYFFIMRRQRGFDYVVLPSSHIAHLIKDGIISGGSDYSITISSDDKRRHFSLNGSNISMYANHVSL